MSNAPVCGAVFVVSLLGTLAWSFFNERYDGGYDDVPMTYQESVGRKAKQTVTAWLEAQRRGEDGLEFWSLSRDVQPSRFYSLRSWEIVDSYVLDDYSVEFVILVNSSLKLGTPITKTWKVKLRAAEITDLVDMSS